MAPAVASFFLLLSLAARPARCVEADARGGRRPHDGALVDGTQALQVELRKDTGDEFVSMNRYATPNVDPSDATESPTRSPTPAPTHVSDPNHPTESPTKSPTRFPTPAPTQGGDPTNPTESPTKSPTRFPTPAPTQGGDPTNPTESPTKSPTRFPTPAPTQGGDPTNFTESPTKSPTRFPTPAPTQVSDPTPSPTPSFHPPTPAPTPSPTKMTRAPTPAPTDEVNATDDPHLVSLGGEKFDVNMPGSYVLIRAPQDRRLPAKLELSASVRPFAGDPCGLYIQAVELSGEWLGDQVVRVVPLQRNAEGPNGAGNSTLRPFSMRVQGVQAQRGASSAASGEYEQWDDLRNKSRALSGRVRLVPLWRQVYADAGRTQEAQAFQFHIRGAGAGYDATLEVAQAAHQALNFRATNLRSLGFEQLGGLLGTEAHDHLVERASDLCRAFRARPSRLKRPAVAEPGPSMSASWD